MYIQITGSIYSRPPILLSHANACADENRFKDVFIHHEEITKTGFLRNWENLASLTHEICLGNLLSMLKFDKMYLNLRDKRRLHFRESKSLMNMKGLGVKVGSLQCFVRKISRAAQGGIKFSFQCRSQTFFTGRRVSGQKCLMGGSKIENSRN